ncbi:MAG: hypothetical protein ACRDGM_17545, partial [bacterium]
MTLTAPGSTLGPEASSPDGAPRVYFDPASVNAARLLAALPVKVVDSAPEADLLWIRKNPQAWYDRLGPFQAINHIPLER